MNQLEDITEQQFLDMVDAFLNQSNQFSQTIPIGKVNAALMLATARYSAFNWTKRTVRKEQTLDEATMMFRSEYEKMFRASAIEIGSTKS